MASHECLTLSIDQGIATVTLNRPDKYNAVNQELFFALIDVGRQLKKCQDIQVVVLHGAGKGFCAGLDVSQFEAFADPSNNTPSQLLSASGEGPTTNAQQAALTFKQLPMPVICAIHGVAYGAGLQIALGADIRIGSPDCTLSVMESQWGLIPDMGASVSLHHIVRIDVAKELTFTGRVVQADEAQQLGLLTRIADNPLEECLKLAQAMTQRSPDALRFSKRLFEHAWNDSALKGLALEAQWQQRLIGKTNQLEAIKAKLENRPAHFEAAED